MSLLTEVKSEATFPEIPIKDELLESYYENQENEIGLKRKQTDWPENFADQNNNKYSFQQTPMTSTTLSSGTKKSKVPSEHFCFLCNKDFANENEFTNHLEQEEPNLYHQCTACAQSFKFRRHFLLHKCDFIDYDDPVIRPVSNQNSDNMVHYACKFCTINNVSKVASRFATYPLYVEHVNKYHRNHVSCALCDEDFKDNFEDYLNHLESGHFIKLPEYDCIFSKDDKTDSKKEEEPIHDTTGDQTFKRCGLCKFTTGNSGELHDHLISHVATGTSRLTLNEHRIYCTYCSMTFNYQHDFDIHLFSHVIDGHHETTSESKNCPLDCPICERGFTKIGQFNSHLNEDHLDFTCGICNDPDFRIQTGHAIENHYKYEHLNDTVLRQIPNYDKKTLSLIWTVIENVFCEHCNRFFNNSSRLADHLTTCLKTDNNNSV